MAASADAAADSGAAAGAVGAEAAAALLPAGTVPDGAEPADADRPVHARSATATAWLPSAEPKRGGELSNGQAVTGLILGILSVFCCWLGLIAAALVLLSLAFSVIGILRARLHFSDGFGVAVAGVVFGVAGLGLYLAFGALGLGMGFRL